MAKFCADCGFQLSGNEKFCGSCGRPVVNLCPTCGQEWNQTPSATAQHPSISPASPAINLVQTNVKGQPIYGSAYAEGKDCPNCGAKGMATKTCTLCESEN